MLMSLEEFRAAHLAPAHSRCDELRAAIAAGESELQALFEALDYDDDAAASVERRLGHLRAALGRWQRRYSYATSRECAQTGGQVLV